MIESQLFKIFSLEISNQHFGNAPAEPERKSTENRPSEKVYLSPQGLAKFLARVPVKKISFDRYTQFDTFISSLKEEVDKESFSTVSEVSINDRFSCLNDSQASYLLYSFSADTLSSVSMVGVEVSSKSAKILLSRLSTLTELRIQCQHIPEDHLRHIAKNSYNLRIVDFTHCTNCTDSVVLTLLSYATSLKELTLNHCPISDDAFHGQFEHLSQLQRLGLKNCKQVTDASIKNLVQQATSLVSVDFSCTKITSEVIQILIKNCSKTLENCYLWKCAALKSWDILKLIRNVVNLKELDVSSLSIVQDNTITEIQKKMQISSETIYITMP